MSHLRSLVAVVVLLAPAGARGEPPVDPEIRKRAETHFRAGAMHYGAGAYDRALVEYQTAFDLAPIPLIRFNIAQAQRQLTLRREALESYRQYLAVEPEGKGSVEARAHVQELERELEEEARAAAAKQELEEAQRREAAAAAKRAEAAAAAQRAETERQAQERRLQPPPVAPAPAKESPSLVRRPLFWGLLGGGALVLAGGIAVTAVFSTSDPTPSLPTHFTY